MHRRRWKRRALRASTTCASRSGDFAGAVRDFAEITNEFPLSKADKSLKRVADALGEVRDLDVAIEALTKTSKDAADPVVRKGISRLIDEFRRDRDGGFEKLREELSDDSLTKLKKQYDAAFNESMCEPDLLGADTIEEAGREIICDCLDRFLKLADCIYHPFALDELHRLRIAGKHLRYALELFNESFDKRISAFAVEVAAMQGHLGDLHDCDVWIDDFSGRLTAVKRKKREMNPDRAAATWLLAVFAVDRTRAYQDALELWSRWESGGFAANLRSALDPPVKRKAAAA